VILTATDRFPALIMQKRQMLPPQINRYEITSLDSSKLSSCRSLLHIFLLIKEGALLPKLQAVHEILERIAFDSFNASQHRIQITCRAREALVMSSAANSLSNSYLPIRNDVSEDNLPSQRSYANKFVLVIIFISLHKSGSL
jgi:hypothetical protein